LKQRNATAVIVGAGDYIGSEIAKKFAAEGFTVFLGRRQGEKLEPLVKDIEAYGGKPPVEHSTRAKKTRLSS
jgi:short-subunit dehydrogenase